MWIIHWEPQNTKFYFAFAYHKIAQNTQIFAFVIAGRILTKIKIRHTIQLDVVIYSRLSESFFVCMWTPLC